MYGNGKHALADALDICAAELEMLIDRNFALKRTLVVEPEGSHWVAAIGDNVLYRSPDVQATLRFAAAFAHKTPGVTVEYEPYDLWSVRVDNLVQLHA